MILSPAVRGLMPLYTEKPFWNCAAICGTGLEFRVKGQTGITQIRNLDGTTAGFANVRQSTVTIKDETCTFSNLSIPNIGNGTYYIETSIDGCTLYSDLFEISDCKDDYVILKGEVECDNLTLGSVGDTVSLPIIYTEFSNGGEEVLSETIADDGTGQSIDIFSKSRCTQTLNACMTAGLSSAIKLLKSYDKVTICKNDGTEIGEIDPKTVTASFGGDTDGFGAGTVGFAFKDSWICKQGCECIELEEFEDDCDDNTNGEDECENIEVNCENSDGLLTAVYSGGNGNPVATWTLNGSFLATGSSVQTFNQPGNYQVSVKYPGCPPETSGCVIMDPCGQFNVQITVAGCKVDGVENNVPDGETVSYEICDSEGTVVGSSLPHVVPEEDGSGSYTVKWKTSDSCCQGIASVFVDKEQPCEHSVSAVKNADGSLTGTIDSCEEATSGIWEAITENGGNVFQQIATGLSFTPTVTGSYRFIGLCGDCSISAEPILCIIEEDKLQIEICPNEVTDDIIEALSNQPDIIVNVPEPNITIINNVDACCDDCDCDEDCTCTFNLRCVANDASDASQGATLTIEPTDCDSATFEVIDPNGQSLGQGLSYQLTVKGIHQIVVSNGECSETQSYDFCLPEAGELTGNAPILTPVPNV